MQYAPFPIRNTSTNGGFTIAMLVCWIVLAVCFHLSLHGPDVLGFRHIVGFGRCIGQDVVYLHVGHHFFTLHPQTSRAEGYTVLQYHSWMYTTD